LCHYTTASCLTALTLRYGMDNVGMDYDRSLFGMKLSDCRSLAKAIERSETLIFLSLSGNLLDDDKVRMVASTHKPFCLRINRSTDKVKPFYLSSETVLPIK
jgi:hypothetical protein